MRRKRTRAYDAWRSMKKRCLNPNDRAYRRWGGRGITVCERWLSFANFLADMGEPPPGTSLDRIENDGNYEPGNCRWATPKEQLRNSRNAKKITYQGRTMCVAEWAEELGFKVNTLCVRLLKGWTVERAFETKVRQP